MPSDQSAITRPRHADVWRSRVACRQFSVMHVCGHHDPPHVTGYWWRGDSLDPSLHDSIPLPMFLASMDLVEREFPDASDEQRYHVRCPECGKEDVVPGGLPGGPALCAHPSAGYVFSPAPPREGRQ